VLTLLRDERARRRMSIRAKGLARPDAATTIARLALNEVVASEVGGEVAGEVAARRKTA